MKKQLTAMVLSGMAVATDAVGDTRYADPAFVLQELEQFRSECSQMLDGEVRQEIFGIEVQRTGDRCIVGPGEVDENLVAFFAANSLDWAGLEGDDSIWVAATD